MSKTFKSFLTAFVLLLISITGCHRDSNSINSHLTPIRIGWQTTWATQGQITQTLSHTNILKKNGLNGKFVGVSYGAPLNEAALAGNVDVIFTADQPAAALLARGADWVIIGRLMFNRVAIYVPPQSPIKTVAQLKGKTIAMPFGAAAQRIALKAISDAGINPNTEITAINLDITEQAGIIERGTAASWGKIDAMAGFDPTVAILEVSQKARILHQGTVTSVIVMSKNYIVKYPDSPKRFLKAFKEAVYYYAHHIERTNNWFLQASQLTFDHKVLALAASVEPNVQASSIDEVNITFSPELIAGMQEAADFIFETGLVKKQVQIAGHIDQNYAEQANTELNAEYYDQASVQLIQKNP